MMNIKDMDETQCRNKLCEYAAKQGNLTLDEARKEQAIEKRFKELLHSPKKKAALDTQVGGGHYKDMAIQPVEFIFKNNLNICQGNIIKYACRYKRKNGLEDLKKIKHYVDLLIELEGYSD